MWQAEADTELTLSALPATAVHTGEGSDTRDLDHEERPPMFTFYGLLAYCSNSNNL